MKKLLNLLLPRLWWLSNKSFNTSISKWKIFNLNWSRLISTDEFTDPRSMHRTCCMLCFARECQRIICQRPNVIHISCDVWLMAGSHLKQISFFLPNRIACAEFSPSKIVNIENNQQTTVGSECDSSSANIRIAGDQLYEWIGKGETIGIRHAAGPRGLIRIRQSAATDHFGSFTWFSAFHWPIDATDSLRIVSIHQNAVIFDCFVPSKRTPRCVSGRSRIQDNDVDQTERIVFKLVEIVEDRRHDPRSRQERHFQIPKRWWHTVDHGRPWHRFGSISKFTDGETIALEREREANFDAILWMSRREIGFSLQVSKRKMLFSGLRWEYETWIPIFCSVFSEAIWKKWSRWICCGWSLPSPETKRTKCNL